MDNFAILKGGGVMADWKNAQENTYVTMDKKYEYEQLKILQDMILNGTVYRGLETCVLVPFLSNGIG